MDETPQAIQEAHLQLEEIVEVYNRIRKGSGETMEKLLWRCVDTAGLLASIYPDAVGVRCGTGRGFQVIRTEPFKPNWMPVTVPSGSASGEED